MSEFECTNGHPMSPKDSLCKICGERVSRMDGKSAKELKAEYENQEDKTHGDEGIETE